MNIVVRTCGARIVAALSMAAVFSVARAQEPSTPSAGAPRAPVNLRVEHRVRPLGLDEPAPRFSFELDDPRRGATQSAYELAVGTDPQALGRDEAVLWTSGKVSSDATAHIEYAGPALAANHVYWWKVRSFDAAGVASPWSAIESWSMGPLAPSDWTAKWISDPAPITKARRAHSGWRSTWRKAQDDMVWVQIDLGQPRIFDTVRIHPARPYDDPQAEPGYLFPLRYRVWVADEPTFLKRPPIRPVDETYVDVKNPGSTPRSHAVGRLNMRFVRVGFLKLAEVPGQGFGAAVAEIELLESGRVVSRGAQVTWSDSLEEGGWSGANLCDGDTQAHAAVEAPPPPAPHLRREFEIGGAVKRALLHSSALGVHEVRLNGERAGDAVLAPEWTRYDARVQYRTADVTALVKPGKNALGVILGDGWYAGRIGLADRFSGYPERGLYGDKPRVLVQLEIEHADGSQERIVTDGSWKSTLEGPIRSSDLLDGETVDLRRSADGNGIGGWDRPGFDDAKWSPVETPANVRTQLVAAPCEPIRVERDVPAVSVREPKPGVYVFDLGETLSGWCRVRCSGKAGDTVTLRHAEMLEPSGELHLANLRGAAQTDRFTLSGGAETLEPRFTYHGFRYVEVSGLGAAPSVADLVGRSIRTAAREVGSFECSEPLLDTIWRNARAARRTNLVGIATDAPARDERLGWLAPFGVAAPAAMYDLDLAAFVEKWARDVRDAQASLGAFGDLAPHPYAPDEHFAGTPGFADAGVGVPWAAWVHYGDRRLLERHFGAAQRHVDYVMNYSRQYLWQHQRGQDLGDLRNASELAGGPPENARCKMPEETFATAHLRRTTQLMSRYARVLGRSEEPTQEYKGFPTTYGDYTFQVANLFDGKLVNSEGVVYGDTQAGNALALAFDLVSDYKRPLLVAKLREDVEARGGVLTGGIHTFHRTLCELSRGGVAADRYLLSTKFPSLGWQIEQGATSMWEQRDGFDRAKGFRDVPESSFDWLAGSAVSEWLSAWLVGLRPDESAPGWKRFTVQPAPTEKVAWARGALDSIRGRIEVEWRKRGGAFELDLLVPPGCTANVVLPAADGAVLQESEKPIAAAAPFVTVVEQTAGRAVLEVQAGRYRLRAGS